MKILVGNWKMNGKPGMAGDLARQAAACARPGAEVVLCPPATLMAEVKLAIAGSQVKLGAQDCHGECDGAFTGDVSAQMVKDAGAAYVIVGHSERRARCGETDADVRAKASQALKAGLTPIICVGETLAEYEAGKAEEVVRTQVAQSVPPEAKKSELLLAYEPVWAIGSGKTPAEGDIRRMHACILSALLGAKVLYGGSVNGGNAATILAIDNVAGVLVGGASVKADEFCRIIAAAPK